MVVDPGASQPVLDALVREQVQLEAILVTHHHADHTGGIDAIRQATGATVYGPARESIPAPLVKRSGGDAVTVLDLAFHVIDVPGHTAGHIAYYCPAVNLQPLLFCGDTLFSGGCGRLFEGTPEQMLASLTTLSELPNDTQVCCTHEYTLANLKFAREVEPDNQALRDYQHYCQGLRSKALPTLPSTVGQERTINPFLRTHTPSVIASVLRYDASAVELHGVFASLREWKNIYR